MLFGKPLMPAFAGVVLGAAIAASLLAPGLAFAQENEGNSLDPRLVTTGPAGLKWIGGDRGSPFMHPGLSCISCHSRGEGPRYQAAGTVYARSNEEDDVFGVASATIQLTDAKGVILKLVSNKAGNFYSGRRDPKLVFPVGVKIFGPNAQNAMLTPAPMGDCLACHTSRGLNGAPGRILAP